MKDCVGGDAKSDAEEREFDNGTEDMQDDLSTENSCEELQADDSAQNESDFDSKGNTNCCLLLIGSQLSVSFV